MSTNFSKVESVFSQIIGAKVQVVTPENEHLIDGITVSIDQLFQCSYNYTHASYPLDKKFNVFVRLPTDQIITLRVLSSDTIREIKSSIEMKTDFPAQRYRLRLLNKELYDDMTVGSNIQPDATLYIVPRLRGGGRAMSKSPAPVYKSPPIYKSPEHVVKLPSTELAPEYDFDFTDMVDDGRTFMRGGYKYERPYGWERIAFNVVGKYEDDSWLGPGGIRTESAVKEWPVSYHGTKCSCVAGIVDEGFKIGPRDLYGPGVYTSPSLTMVAEHYARIVLQTRVDPKSLEIIPKALDGCDYWKSPEGSAVRAYGLLLKRKNPPPRPRARLTLGKRILSQYKKPFSHQYVPPQPSTAIYSQPITQQIEHRMLVQKH